MLKLTGKLSSRYSRCGIVNNQNDQSKDNLNAQQTSDTFLVERFKTKGQRIITQSYLLGVCYSSLRFHFNPRYRLLLWENFIAHLWDSGSSEGCNHDPGWCGHIWDHCHLFSCLQVLILTKPVYLQQRNHIKNIEVFTPMQEIHGLKYSDEGIT